jgi:hypothetical protein
MLRIRSTSPPKSAWPGVSTMLMRVPFHSTEVALARMVIPRSRSRSLLSIARSATAWLSRKAPDCFSDELVDQRGLAVVDVGDDRDIAQIHRGFQLQSAHSPALATSLWAVLDETEAQGVLPAIRYPDGGSGPRRGRRDTPGAAKCGRTGAHEKGRA